MKNKITIDTFDIANRIKDIDVDYFIIFDTDKCVFEIHNSRQCDSTYCLTVPYDYLDERTLKYVNMTKSENIDKILEKIDNDNQVLENSEKSKTREELGEKLEEIQKE